MIESFTTEFSRVTAWQLDSALKSMWECCSQARGIPLKDAVNVRAVASLGMRKKQSLSEERGRDQIRVPETSFCGHNQFAFLHSESFKRQHFQDCFIFLITIKLYCKSITYHTHEWLPKSVFFFIQKYILAPAHKPLFQMTSSNLFQ